MHLVLAAGQRLQEAARLARVGRLAERAPVDGDDRVHAQHRPARRLRGHRTGLAGGMRPGDLRRLGVGHRQLVVLGMDDLELDADLLQDRPPLRRAGGQKQRPQPQRRGDHTSSDSAK